MKSKKPLITRLVANWPVKILSLAAAVILFMLNRISTLDERYLQVPLRIVTTANLVPSTSYPRMVRLTLRGEANALAAIMDEDFDVYADFSKQKGEGVYRSPIEVKRKGTALNVNPLETRVDPPEIMIGLDRRLTRTVSVVPNFKGYMEPGYELSEYAVVPSSVEVSGPRSLIEKLTDVSTEQIELSGRKADFTAKVSLAKRDPLVSLTGTDTVQFTGKVLESIVLKTIEGIQVAPVGLAHNLAIDGTLPLASLKIQGSQQDVSTFVPEATTLSIDFSSIKDPGLYTLPVSVSLPPNIAELKHDPAEISLHLILASMAPKVSP
jgi:hypothetical protein